MATRWAIVSTGKISNDFTLCLNALPRYQHKIVAVSARSLDSAKKFAEKHGILKAYGSQKELSQDPDVEIVYIANLNMDHYETAKTMLEAGKHVLCEKPLTMNLADTEKLIALARKQKTFFMEAVWSRCSPIYQQVRKEIASGVIGDVRFIEASFGVPISNVDSVAKLNLGGSAVLNIGVYVIQLATEFFGGEMPYKIVANGHLNEEGVDEVATITLMYRNEGIASLHVSTRYKLHNEVFIYGEEQFLRICAPLWCPTKLVTPARTYEIELPKLKEKPNGPNSEGLTFEAMHVRECLVNGLLESPLMPLDQSRVIAAIEEEVRKQLGATFIVD